LFPASSLQRFHELAGQGTDLTGLAQDKVERAPQAVDPSPPPSPQHKIVSPNTEEQALLPPSGLSLGPLTSTHLPRLAPLRTKKERKKQQQQGDANVR
jgi:hypothetical protein